VRVEKVTTNGEQDVPGAQGSERPPGRTDPDLQPRLLEFEVAQDPVHYLVRELAVASHPEKRLTLRPKMDIVALIVNNSRSSNVFAPSIRREETFPRIFFAGILLQGGDPNSWCH
jgi:hypothetical protein